VAIHDRVGERLDLDALGDVELGGFGRVTLVGDEPDGLRGALVVDVGRHDVDAGLRIADRDRPPQAAAAAGDDRHAPGDVEERGDIVGWDRQAVFGQLAHEPAPGSLG
jgi:hypothetical protein